MKRSEVGFTLVELVVSMTVVSVLALGAFQLFISLLHSAMVAQRQAVASTLATNQMEYIKSLPYDSLAVAGGAIVSSTTIPSQVVKKVDGRNYTIKTSITYADDAYDGCGSYPTTALRQQYCRNYPAPGGSGTDLNAGDYKDITVTVTDISGTKLATLDTQIAALVAETDSNTGALFIRAVDDAGNPIQGATVTATNSFTSPTVNISDTTDISGMAIFYNLPPSSTGYRYVVSGSKSQYSSLTTIAPSGSLIPTYSSQNLITQSSSYVTLTLKPQGERSLIVETTDVSGNPLANVRVNAKGGYKRYTSTTDNSYYYDTLSPTDTRPTTDASGVATMSNLVPGAYMFCGDTGATGCVIGGTTYYLAAAVPYGGSNSLLPITVPIYSAETPPTTTFDYGGNSYLQKVRLMLTTNASFPRVRTISPDEVSLSGGNLTNVGFTITGVNLPCSSSAASCATTVRFTQNAQTYTASCTGSSVGQQLNCRVNLSSATAGNLRMAVTVGGNTLTLPDAPLLGGVLATQ
jgi:prepilin-type N-terminal cleavage/methylation domain-containing protein